MQERLSLRPDHVPKKRVNYVTAKSTPSLGLEDKNILFCSHHEGLDACTACCSQERRGQGKDRRSKKNDGVRNTFLFSAFSMYGDKLNQRNCTTKHA